MDGKKQEFSKDIITKILSFIHNDLSLSIPVHLELASIGDLELMKYLSMNILPFVDSLGLNEQELGLIFFSLNGEKNLTQNSFKNPQIKTIINSIKFIFQKMKNFSHIEKTRQLSRIHFHCLTFHLIAEKIPTFFHWKNTEKSIVAGSLESTKQACEFKNVEILMEAQKDNYSNFNSSYPVSIWYEEDIHFYLCPVLVCKNPSKTVGLGDSISSTALIYQLFDSFK